MSQEEIPRLQQSRLLTETESPEIPRLQQSRLLAETESPEIPRLQQSRLPAETSSSEIPFIPLGGFPPLYRQEDKKVSEKTLESRGFVSTNIVSISNIMSSKKKENLFNAFGTDEEDGVQSEIAVNGLYETPYDFTGIQLEPALKPKPKSGSKSKSKSRSKSKSESKSKSKSKSGSKSKK